MSFHNREKSRSGMDQTEPGPPRPRIVKANVLVSPLEWSGTPACHRQPEKRRRGDPAQALSLSDGRAGLLPRHAPSNKLQVCHCENSNEPPGRSV